MFVYFSTLTFVKSSLNFSLLLQVVLCQRRDSDGCRVSSRLVDANGNPLRVRRSATKCWTAVGFFAKNWPSSCWPLFVSHSPLLCCSEMTVIIQSLTTSNYWEKLFLEIFLLTGGTHLEEELTSEIAHLRQRVSQVEMINQARRRDLALLTQHVNRSLPLIWSKLPALSIVFLIISHFHFFP